MKERIYTWTNRLQVFEIEHLKDEGIGNKTDLEESIKWGNEVTTPCKQCELIREKLK